MSYATEEQLAKLRKFIDARPAKQGWEFMDRAFPFANWTAPITETHKWWIQLEPKEPEDSPYATRGGHPTWKASCQKGENGATSEMGGDFAECVAWIDNRCREYELARDVAAELVGFAADRRHWRFVDRGDGRHYAGRTFEHPDGQRFLLSVSPHHAGRRRPRFTAQLNASFAAGPEHQVDVDTVADAGAWVKAWYAPLEVPIKLNGCKRGREAQNICRQLSAEQITKLAHLVGIHMVSRGQIVCELIRRYAPSARG